MDTNYRQTVIALFFATLMIGSPIATAVSGSSVAPAVSDETFELDDNGDVSVWERSMIPLRANTDDATTTIDVPTDLRYEQGKEQIESDIDSVGVFKPNTPIDFTFKFRTGATISNLDLNDSNTQVHTVRLDEDAPSSDLNSDDVPNTLEELRDQLTTENVNANATFDNITAQAVSSGYDGGELTFTNNFDSSGIYAVMVTKHEQGKDGLVIDGNGNLSQIDGEVLISGLETVAVQQDVDANAGAPSSVAPGNDLTFNAEGNLQGVSSNVSHMVAVYKQDTVTDDTLIVNVPDTVNSETNLSNFTIESDIGFVSGVSNVEDDVTVLGNTLEAREDNGQFTFDSIVSRIATEANSSEPEVKTNEEILNASATGVVDTDSSSTVTVETLSSWEEGTYRYVYIASGGDSTEFSTATGTLSIQEQQNNNNNRRRSSGSDDDDDDDDESTEETTEEETQDAPTAEEVREEIEQTEPSRETTTEIVDSDPDTPGVSVTPEKTQSVRQITFQDEGASGTVTVREYDEPPESLSESVTAALNRQQTDNADSDGSDSETQPQTTRQARVVSVSDISPDSESANGPATIVKTVDRDKFENPENAVVFHERGKTWEELPTTVEDAGDGEITVTAETDSFSLFAVAEVEQTQSTQTTTDGQTESTDNQEESTGGQEESIEDSSSGPGTGAIIGVLVVLSLIAAVLFAYNRQ